jgi:hypothetical protein
MTKGLRPCTSGGGNLDRRSGPFREDPDLELPMTVENFRSLFGNEMPRPRVAADFVERKALDLAARGNPGAFLFPSKLT